MIFHQAHGKQPKLETRNFIASMSSGDIYVLSYHFSPILLCVLVVPHSNVGDEKTFSKLEKNSRLEKKTDFRSRFQLDGSLNLIVRIKMSIPESLTACHKWKPSPSLLKACNQVTKTYNDLQKSKN